METLDLYLIHAPWPWSEVGADYTRENIETWRAMEEIGQNGRCRAVGVSNFSVSDLKAILDNGTVKPAANQIRYFIGHTQEALTQFCMDEGILVEGYSPLATGRILKNPEVAAIAAKYGVSLPQVCIRYVLQKNVLPLPKAVQMCIRARSPGGCRSAGLKTGCRRTRGRHAPPAGRRSP